MSCLYVWIPGWVHGQWKDKEKVEMCWDLLYHLREKGESKRHMVLKKGILALYKILLYNARNSLK